MSADTAAIPLADGVCLCLIDEADDDHPIHGWHLVRLLAPGGDLGRIWSLSRALTYRSVDRLIDRGLVTRDDHGDDRRRRLRPTAAGRRRARVWLDTPVEHVRDLRTGFLVAIELRRRRGLDIAGFAARQLDVLSPALDALIHDTATDADVDPVVRWRHHSAGAARAFLIDMSQGHSPTS